LENKKFVFTDPMSHSGKLYADMRVKELRRTPDNFFSKFTFSHAHDISMQLVSKNVIDGATVNGLIYNYLENTDPERVASLKIIEKSAYYGMPPIVVPTGLPEQKKEKLRTLLLELHQDPAGKKILDKLLIDKFIPGNDADYNTIREMVTFIEQ
jgi:phosphonate transport system substrate-binding protein